MLKINILSLHGIKEKRAEKLYNAIRHAEEIINNSSHFQGWFLKQKFTQLGAMKGKTNEEMLELIRREVRVHYSVVYRSWWKRMFSSVVGYTKKITKTPGEDVFTYADSFDAMSLFGLVDHITHEVVCHCNGFTHEYNWSKERDFSVPYLVGKTVEAMALVKKA